MPTPAQVIDPITIDNYGRMAWDQIVKHYPTAKTFMAKGNINRDVGGKKATWPLEVGRNDVHITQDFEDVAQLYTLRRPYTDATVDWGQFAVLRAISKGELKQNSGQEALVRFGQKVVPSMFRDGLVGPTNSLFWQFFNINLYSYTTANNKVPMGGLPSVFVGTTAITWSSTAKEGTINNTNYGGLTCVSGGLSTVADGVENDAWTPKAINTTSTAWASGTASFRTNAFEILTYTMSSVSFAQNDPRFNPDEFVMTKAMFNSVGYQMNQKQSFLLEKAVGKKAVFGIGNDTYIGLEHNGVPIRWDELIPTDTGYCLNYNQMYLDLLSKFEFSKDGNSVLRTSGDEDSIFETEVRYNDGRRAVTVSATVDGQFRINPKYQAMMYAGA